MRQGPAGEPLWEVVTAAVLRQFVPEPAAGAQQVPDPQHADGVRMMLTEPELHGEVLKASAAADAELAAAIAERTGADLTREIYPKLAASFRYLPGAPPNSAPRSGGDTRSPASRRTWTRSRSRSTARTAATGRLNVPGQQPIPPFICYRTDHGGFSFAPFPGKPPLIATSEWDQPVPQEPMNLGESVHRVLGADVPFGPPDGQGPHALRRLSGGNNRVAERFRAGRVFLIGDAAHVDAAGGQGLNLGMQDAINLGWKLAAGVRGTAPQGLLGSHEPERRRAAERVNTYAQAISALVAPGGEVTALREVFGELLADAGTVRRLTAGTDVHYDMGGDCAHPLVGKPLPDLTLDTPQGTVRLAQLARTGREPPPYCCVRTATWRGPRHRPARTSRSWTRCWTRPSTGSAPPGQAGARRPSRYDQTPGAGWAGAMGRLFGGSRAASIL